MSCTAFAIPLALGWIVESLIPNDIYSDVEWNKRIIEEGRNNRDDEIRILPTQQLTERAFETPFMDKDLLIKTLEEHGATNIEVNESGKISCQVESFSLDFDKYENDKPYSLKISCFETDDANEKVDDLNSEYALNVQEEAYLNIIDKLKENNMNIEEEEVMDDNTIVLTINLE